LGEAISVAGFHARRAAFFNLASMGRRRWGQSPAVNATQINWIELLTSDQQVAGSSPAMRITFPFEIEGFLDSNPNFTDMVKLFYTGPVVNAELLVMMLEKHGIAATQNFVDAPAPDDGDLSRPAQVFVPEADYDRAYQLFYAEREDEL
jgi:hypothetical protein